MIRNRSDKSKTLIDFVVENRHLVDEYNKQYDAEYKLSELVADAEERVESYPDHWIINAQRDVNWDFGDEDGDILGIVYDYILRDSNLTDGWSCSVLEFLR